MKIRKEKFADLIIYSAILIGTILILSLFETKGKNPLVYFSFLVIGILSYINIIFSSWNICIHRNINIFCYIFFFIAPWQQYSEGISLWKKNGLSIQYTDEMYLKANILVVLFLVIYNMGYRHFEKKRIICKKKFGELEEENFIIIPSRQSKMKLLFISTISLLVLFVTGNLTGTGITIGNAAINSQIWHMVCIVPVCAIILYVMAYHSIEKLFKQKSFLIIFVEFLIIFFPFWGNLARFLLFGVYIIVLSLFFGDTKQKSWYFLAIYIGFCFGFSSMRHATSISSLLTNSLNFSHVDFDAHQILMTVICYTEENGIVYGKNIMSALAFILPRSVWTGKLPNSGGIAVSYFGSWFTNVSSPIVGELFFAFGSGGILFGSIGIAKLSSIIDSWGNEQIFLKKGIFCISAGMTIYICRGSLLASVSFTFGLIVALWLISLITKINKYRNYNRE